MYVKKIMFWFPLKLENMWPCERKYQRTILKKNIYVSIDIKNWKNLNVVFIFQSFIGPKVYTHFITINIGYNDDDCGISFEVPNLALSSSLSASEHLKHQFSPCCWVIILLQNILNISSHQFSLCCWVIILLQNILNISSPPAAG